MENERKRKVYSITMAKNEADIIESFVRYHMNIFDGMIILDNKSTDNTLKILNQLKNEGLPLFILEDWSFEFLQSEKMTNLMYSTLRQYNPDIIFPLDADEFVVSTNNKNPRDIIEKLDLMKFYYINCISYLPQETDNPNELFVPKRITHRAEYHHKEKICITKWIINKYKPSITFGNHNLKFVQKMQQKPSETCKDLKIAHFHIRSIEQAKSKFAVGWLGHLARDNRSKGEGFHKENAFYKILNNPDATLKDLLGNPATSYSPINLSFCKNIGIKYTKHNEVNFIKNLLQFSKSIAEEFVKIKKGK